MFCIYLSHRLPLILSISYLMHILLAIPSKTQENSLSTAKIKGLVILTLRSLTSTWFKFSLVKNKELFQYTSMTTVPMLHFRDFLERSYVISPRLCNQFMERDLNSIFFISMWVNSYFNLIAIQRTPKVHCRHVVFWLEGYLLLWRRYSSIRLTPNPLLTSNFFTKLW